MRRENEDYLLLVIAGALLIVAVLAVAIVMHQWVGWP